jgi:hypothetical protein
VVSEQTIFLRVIRIILATWGSIIISTTLTMETRLIFLIPPYLQNQLSSVFLTMN